MLLDNFSVFVAFKFKVSREFSDLAHLLRIVKNVSTSSWDSLDNQQNFSFRYFSVIFPLKTYTLDVPSASIPTVVTLHFAHIHVMNEQREWEARMGRGKEAV